MENKYCKFCNQSFEVPKVGEKNDHWVWVKAPKNILGYRLRCRIQKRKKYDKNSRNTIEKYVHYIWRHVKSRCDNPNDISYKRYQGKLYLTEQEFKTWGNPTLKEFVEKNNVQELHNSRISIDRVDDSKGYKLGNLQWLFVRYNILKEMKKRHKKVNQKDLEGNLIKTWDYVNQVKEGGFFPGNVVSACKGDFKQYKGFLWEYAN